jgi:hypothetical protein
MKASATSIALNYGVCQKIIRDIWTARTWSDVTRRLDPLRAPHNARAMGRGRLDSGPRKRRLAAEGNTERPADSQAPVVRPPRGVRPPRHRGGGGGPNNAESGGGCSGSGRGDNCGGSAGKGGDGNDRNCPATRRPSPPPFTKTAAAGTPISPSLSKSSSCRTTVATNRPWPTWAVASTGKHRPTANYHLPKPAGAATSPPRHPRHPPSPVLSRCRP